MTPRLLILSLYYPPDLSACSFRTAALVEAIRTAAPDLPVDVITSMPNRYHSYNTAAQTEERVGAVTVRRLAMPVHRSDMVTQATAYARFAYRANRVASAQHYDLVFATSSRLMTAALGAWVSWRGQAPLYLDIRDLFVDTMGDILPPRLGRPLKPLISLIERWTIRRADHVNLVSRGFESYVRHRYPGTPLSFYTNGIDDEFLGPTVESSTPPGRPATVVYAGNLGEGQGLHLIVPEVARRLAGRAVFRLIGDGGRRTQLLDALTAAGVTNVEVVPPMPRAELLAEYRAADVLFLHLNAHDAFTRVLPSKIFEYAALGKPIWAGVAGHAAEFLRTEVSNAAVFAPCDPDAAVEAWNRIAMVTEAREAFVAKFSRKSIMTALAADILRYQRSGGQ